MMFSIYGLSFQTSFMVMEELMLSEIKSVPRWWNSSLFKCLKGRAIFHVDDLKRGCTWRKMPILCELLLKINIIFIKIEIETVIWSLTQVDWTHKFPANNRSAKQAKRHGWWRALKQRLESSIKYHSTLFYLCSEGFGYASGNGGSHLVHIGYRAEQGSWPYHMQQVMLTEGCKGHQSSLIKKSQCFSLPFSSKHPTTTKI